VRSGAGERLPPAKDLAAVLGVNTNTALRALRVLRDEGLLEFRRGRGITVVGSPERGAVMEQARNLVDFARRHGYRLDELVAIIEDVA
jgi:GntR family transcriptional regulator